MEYGGMPEESSFRYNKYEYVVDSKTLDNTNVVLSRIFCIIRFTVSVLFIDII